MNVALAQAFLAKYETELPSLNNAVDLLRQELIKQLRDNSVPVSAVYGRAKTIESVRGKLLKKAYLDPAREMTDIVGLRVVVLHGAEVDLAVSALSRNWSVISEYSIDKRTALGLREFGYRSVHLVCEIPQQVCDKVRLESDRAFEVQVRSLLEHAWAEIEHGVVYKAGAQLPDLLRRRFASLAAVAELMEAEFERLGDETRRLADIEKTRVFSSGFSELAIDVPRLIAVLETYRPTGASLRLAEGLSASLLGRIVDALRLCEITTTHTLALAVLSSSLLEAASKFADDELIAADAVSHLAICLLLIGQANQSVLTTFFPEFASSSAIKCALHFPELGQVGPSEVAAGNARTKRSRTSKSAARQGAD